MKWENSLKVKQKKKKKTEVNDIQPKILMM